MGKKPHEIVRGRFKVIVPAEGHLLNLVPQEPVRVKLRRVSSDQGEILPPAGDQAAWRQRLKDAFGTESSDFVDTALFQLQLATRPNGAAVSEAAINAALAMIEAWGPQNAVEAAMALQAACTHSAAMAVLCRARGANGGERHVTAMSNAAAKLLTISLAQAEHFRRLRHGTSQSIRVEHVHVHEGGQAVIGNVKR
jgi:hypothetical protein